MRVKCGNNNACIHPNNPSDPNDKKLALTLMLLAYIEGFALVCGLKRFKSDILNWSEVTP